MLSDLDNLYRDGIDCYKLNSKYCNSNGYFITLEPKLSEEMVKKYGAYGVQAETFKVTEAIFYETKLGESFTINFKRISVPEIE